MAEEKSKILIIGDTGHIGKFIVAGSYSLGHPTFILVRDPNPSDTAKAKLVDNFKISGVKLIQGDFTNHESLVKALKQVDVVVSAVGFMQLKDQWKLLDAIKEAGNIKRFVPSDFSSNVDLSEFVEPAKSMIIDIKVRFQRAAETSGIPYTFVSSNHFAFYFLPTLALQTELVDIRKESKFTIYGDGNAKAVFVEEGDIGRYTTKAVEDPRTLNKLLHIRRPANTLSQNDIVLLLESKVGRTYKRVFISEDEILKQIPASSFPLDVALAICISTLVKGERNNYETGPSIGVEATSLYRDVRYTTVDQYSCKMCY